MSSMQTPATSAEPFAVVRRGFDREQVTAMLQRLEAEAELLRADRDAAVERAERATAEAARDRARVTELESRVAELGRAPVTNDQMSDRLTTMLSLATAEAASIRDSANITADQILTQAEDDAWRLREAATAELDEIRTRNTAVRSEHARVLDDARSRASEIIRSSERAARAKDDEAARRRAQVDEDHRLASDMRRQESLREEQELQATYRRNAENSYLAAAEVARKTRDDAWDEATSMIADATAHTNRLREVRRTVLADLASIRARLEVIPTDVDDTPLPMPPEFPDRSGGEAPDEVSPTDG